MYAADNACSARLLRVAPVAPPTASPDHLDPLISVGIMPRLMHGMSVPSFVKPRASLAQPNAACEVGPSHRLHFIDACASAWIDGELVHIEDLVLHDAAVDIRSPTRELTRTHAVMKARRRILLEPPQWALSSAGLTALIGRAGLPQPEKPTRRSGRSAVRAIPSVRSGSSSSPSISRPRSTSTGQGTSVELNVEDFPATAEGGRERGLLFSPF
jgi:hypothetical protein